MPEKTRSLRKSGPETSPPLPPLVLMWLDAYADKPNTRRTYEHGIRQWLAFLEGRQVALLEAAQEDAEAWRVHLLARKAAPSTVVRKLSTAASFYQRCAHQRLVDVNPFAYVDRPEVDPEVGNIPALNRADVAALLAAAEAAGPRTHVAVSLMLFTAIRASELLGVRVESFTAQDGYLVFRVRRKGGKRDEVAVPDRVSHDVDALRGQRTTGLLLSWDHDGEVPWSYDALLDAVSRAGRAAGIAAPVTPHMLRVTWATEAIEAGVPLSFVQDVMGHASPNTTRRYDRAKHKIGRKIQAVEAVAAVFGKGIAK